ncbi:hypothetical protein F4553_007358 [Allocatelliglobosispora scoriae]|uniref:PH domain-containing protein n=1 Tax=Allocatelliglobosispora scoriae TaxID=643052 RepID=A0A841C0M3_9ACTN|nr:hypothetical protein [Allocatelliglobosispora scoriae]MBB5873924.1 hypothetical protein [Allocatelliglobosispora scoriae]
MNVLALAKRVALFELRLWRSLYRWVFRRPLRLEPGATAFSYAGVVTPVLIGFLVVSAIEIPVMHLILPWSGARIILFVLGVQGLLWMIGLLASLRVHPHVVGASGLRIANGSSIEIHLPWDAIAEIRTRMRSLPTGKTLQFDAADASILSVAMSSQTNLDVVLREPMALRLPSGTSEPVTELRFFADDHRGLADRAREHLQAGSSTPA